MKVKMTITLENGKKIKLREDEARELYNTLHFMYGKHYTTYPWFTYTSDTAKPYETGISITSSDVNSAAYDINWSADKSSFTSDLNREEK